MPVIICMVYSTFVSIQTHVTHLIFAMKAILGQLGHVEQITTCTHKLT